MNREDVLQMLLAILADFFSHRDFANDIALPISRTGYETKFFNLLLVRLKFLREHGVNAIKHEEFESLTKSNGIFSMHLTGQGFNYRILYSFLPDGIPVLLLGFYKRSGKRRTDYTPYIPLAEKRMAEETEAHKNGTHK